MSLSSERLAQLALDVRSSEVSPLYDEIHRGLLAQLAISGTSMEDLAHAENVRRANMSLITNFLEILPRSEQANPTALLVDDAYEALAAQAAVVWIDFRQQYKLLATTVELREQITGRKRLEPDIDPRLLIPRPFYVLGKERPITGYHRFLLADASREFGLVYFTASRFSGARLLQQKLNPTIKGREFGEAELKSMYLPDKHVLTVSPRSTGSAYYIAKSFQRYTPVETLEDADMADFDIHNQLIGLASIFQKDNELKNLLRQADQVKNPPAQLRLF